MDVSVLLEPTIDLKRLAEVLDGLGHEGRIHTTCTWNKAKQAAIFEAAKGFKAIDTEYLVPSSVGALVTVSHYGHNSLPSPLSRFIKHMCRVEAGAEELAGYNEQSMAPLTGPGYFTVHNGDGEHVGEAVIDYGRIPKSKPDGWPEIVGNDGLISGIVNGGMIDYVRGISTHVAIGAAFKNGKTRNEFFTIVRKDVS